METFRILGIAATSMIALTAQALPSEAGAQIAGIERLGVSAVVVALLFWLFLGERSERREFSAKLNAELQATIQRNQEVLREHAEAMKENAAANKSLGAAIIQLRGRGNGSSLPD